MRMQDGQTVAENPKIGFACAWKGKPERTWSGTPWGLRLALGRQAEIVDLGVEYSAAQTVSKYLYTRRRHGRWGSTYQWSSSRDRMIERKLQAASKKTPVDAVIEVGDLGKLDAPFYCYKDLSFAVLEEHYDHVVGAPGFHNIDLDTIRRRRDRQHALWESAAGVFAMSEWLAEVLVEQSGLPREKVTVVYAGLNALDGGTVGADHIRPEESPARQPARLLFVGRDFFRKGGDIVVRAFEQLRREHYPDLRLTVAGPAAWPLAGEVPEGVAFLGDRPTEEVARLYREHDVLVMPSRFEAFGIAHREALANGMPVIGRSDFAMPEAIHPGKNGALVGSDDPAELAAAIVHVLEHPEVRRYTVSTAAEVRARYSWDAVAKRMLDTIRGLPAWGAS
jgi:glycosyltransferase involved in cell wall biosynthesis